MPEDMPEGSRRSTAPWTEDEVASLNAYQAAGLMHPFTGEVPPEGGERPILIATPEGWIETAGGPVVQTWAWRWMTDGTWDWRSVLDAT